MWSTLSLCCRQSCDRRCRTTTGKPSAIMLLRQQHLAGGHHALQSCMLRSADVDEVCVPAAIALSAFMLAGIPG